MSCLITMSQKELNRLEAVQKIKDRRLSVIRAAEMLGLSRSHLPGLVSGKCDCTYSTLGRVRLM